MGQTSINDKRFPILHQSDIMRTDIRAAGKSTLAIGWISSPFDSFVVTGSSVLRTNSCTEKPVQ